MTPELEEMAVRSRDTVARRAALLLLLGFVPLAVHARPLSSEARGRLAAGQSTAVIVEFDATSVDRAAVAERARRGLRRDDAAILAMRSRGYAAVRASVGASIGGADAASIHDYQHFPLAVWRLSSINALDRLLAYPGVRAVHENLRLHPVSVSDLPFINQPQAASEGATGNGTTIAVIDGGLGTNYLNFSDFGTCTGVDTPASTCRVVFNWDFYSGAKASQETTHGTNVSAIALGVAPGAKLAMFDVFQGTSASSADLNTALDTIIQDQATYNIVAISMSLGDGTSNTSQCGGPGQSPFTTPIANALAAGIAVVVAAGNSGSKTGLSDPACVPGVISVGAVYDNSYGTVTWGAPADSGGQCTDASAPDHVTCFSQSANYLSILAPGTFVNAPTSAFQQSGTSQATPHVSGAVAVLRARYPAETVIETLKRMQLGGTSDTDAANGRTTPRLNLVAAVNQGTSLSLSGSGPSTATAGGNAIYTITVTNSGPIDATTIRLTDKLPPGATFTSASSGCTFSASYVTCNLGDLAANASITITINVTWNGSGPVYDTAAVTADQVNTSSQPTISFGTAIVASEDAPLPIWAYGLLGIAIFALGWRQPDSLTDAPRS